MKTLLLALSFLMTYSAHSAEADNRLLTLWISGPERSIDWKTPGSLYRSFLINSILAPKRLFGSAVAVLHCGKDNNALETEGISADSESINVFGPVVFQGRGLGHLFTAHPGKLLSSEEAIGKRNEMLKDNLPAESIAYIISQKHCDRIQTYLSEVKKHGFAKNFGLPHRPLMAEGMTDTSLVISILQVAGIIGPKETESWERVVILPKNLSGAPLTDEYISIFSLLTGSWANNANEGYVLRFWDPALIAKYIRSELVKDINKLNQGTLGAGKRVGESIDKTRSPVPEGTFWEQANDPQYSKKKN
jgi:hypothetical protein